MMKILLYDSIQSKGLKQNQMDKIKLLQSVSPLGFNEEIYHEGNISLMPDFDMFSL